MTKITLTFFLFTVSMVGFTQIPTKTVITKGQRPMPFTETYSVVKNGEKKGVKHGDYHYDALFKKVKGTYYLGLKSGVWEITTRRNRYLQYYSSGRQDSMVFYGSSVKHLVVLAVNEQDTVSHHRFYDNGAWVVTRDGINHYYLDFGRAYVGNDSAIPESGQRSEILNTLDSNADRSAFTSFYQNGQVFRVKQLNPQTKKLHGAQVVLYGDGDTASIGHYVKGKRHGSFTGYARSSNNNKKGTLLYTYRYEEDKLMDFVRFLAEGQPDSNFLVSNGSGLCIQGNYDFEVFTISEGRMHGIRYSFEGNEQTSTNYLNGVPLFQTRKEYCLETNDTADLPSPHQSLSGNFQIKAGFVDGELALYQYVSENIKIPEIALEESGGGTVLVQFVVEKNGHVSNITTCNKPLGFGLEQAAMNVVEATSGHWNPALVDGFPARMRFNLPVRFVFN